MPYTPPSQQSPASSKLASPAISQSSSISGDAPKPPTTGRPQLLRSHTFASYMTRHRRSPPLTKSDGPPSPTEAPQSHVQAKGFTQRASVRQSPPPVNDLVLPTDAVISPPDSENFDSDDRKERGHELGIAELQNAVRSVGLRRDGSPDKVGKHIQRASEPVSQTTSPTALTPEARKISHSRSNTDTAILILRPTFPEFPTQTTDDSEEDDYAPLDKPSLVRKKSGELVKPALRPSSRRRYFSMPGTPTYFKSVHFNDSDNQTRHFLQVERPMAVSTGTSPVETYDSETEYPLESDGKASREIKLINFPQDSFERKLKPVRIERIFLSSDKDTVIGTVAVQNISFHKLVIARFTLDYWKTTSEVVAEYNNDPRNPSNDGCDRFNFHIKLSDSANIDNKSLLLCARYNVNGRNYWDNNGNLNYHVNFVKDVKKSKTTPNSQLGARPLNTIPRSQHLPPSSSHSRGRTESIDDESGTRFDMDSTYQFGGAAVKIMDEPGGSTKLKSKPKGNDVLSTGPTQPHNNLGGRYDFGPSLSATLTTAQDRLGRNGGAMSTLPQKSNDGGYFSSQERKEGPSATKEGKPGLNGDRPAMGSAQYRDLVQKSCYFTSSGPGKGISSPPTSRKPSATQADGADDISVSTASSGWRSPQTPRGRPQRARQRQSALNAFVSSRSSSPTPFMVQDYAHGAASPASFGYPYPSSMHDGCFDSPQLADICG